MPTFERQVDEFISPILKGKKPGFADVGSQSKFSWRPQAPMGQENNPLFQIRKIKKKDRPKVLS